MPSPFPGVDPYLESQGYWPDFHGSFLIYWRDTLAEMLPEQYEARLDERVNLIEVRPERLLRRIEPDLAVERRGPASAQIDAGGSVAVAVATLEPVTVPQVIQEEKHETYIEILHRPERSLVAVLELLSPSNKEEPGCSAYLTKRNTVLNHEVHLVELDFLLGGRRLPPCDSRPGASFYALVSPADRRPDCDVYAWGLRDRLPVIPLPLRSPDRPLGMDLAALFTIAYDRGRYARSIDYSRAPTAVPAGADRDWAAQVPRPASK
jgi:hypothetical protein